MIRGYEIELKMGRTYGMRKEPSFVWDNLVNGVNKQKCHSKKSLSDIIAFSRSQTPELKKNHRIARSSEPLLKYVNSRKSSTLPIHEELAFSSHGHLERRESQVGDKVVGVLRKVASDTYL